MKAKTPPAPASARETVSFGVRLDADLIGRLDAYAAAHQHKRGWALARAVEAGLDSLDGQPELRAKPALNEPKVEAPLSGELGVQLIADRVAVRLKPFISADLFCAGLKAGRADAAEFIARVGGAVEHLQAAAERFRRTPGMEARAEFAVAVELGIARLTAGASLLGLGERRGEVGGSPKPSLSRGALADALKAARKSRRLSQNQAAAEIGSSSVDFKRAERAVPVGEELSGRLWAWVASGPPEVGLDRQSATPTKRPR